MQNIQSLQNIKGIGISKFPSGTLASSLLTGITSYYKFDENTGTTVGDSAGVNTGTWNGSGTVWTTGRINSGGNFVTTNNNYVNISGNSGLYLNTGYSISLWVKCSGLSGIQDRFFCLGNSSQNNQIWILERGTTDSSKLSMFVRNDANVSMLSQVDSATTIIDGNWHHIVWTDNNGTAKLYIDGTQDGTNFNYVRSGTFTFDRAAIGCLLRSGVGNPVTGTIDEVGIWSRILSATEVTTLYNGGVGDQYPF